MVFVAPHNDFSLQNDSSVTQFACSQKGDRYELYASNKCVSGVCGVRIRSFHGSWYCALIGNRNLNHCKIYQNTRGPMLHRPFLYDR